MFIVLSGNDFISKKKKIDAVKKSLFLKRPDAEHITIDSFDIEKNMSFLESFLDAVGLFEEKSIISCINILEKPEIKKFFLKNIEKFSQSENVFIFSEEKITTPDQKKIEPHAYQFMLFNSLEKKFNLFSLTDLLASKKKKELYILFHEALQTEDAESIYNIFTWQLKTLFLVSEKDSISETSLKPFVYNKNKNFLRNWRKEEIEEKYFDLLKIQQTNRKNSTNLDLLLEKFILKL